MEVLEAQGFRVVPVDEQMTPDGQFPNVTQTPNPEVPESMDRAGALAAQKHRPTLSWPPIPTPTASVLWSPDRSGNCRCLTGNEIAALLTHFKLSKLAQAGPPAVARRSSSPPRSRPAW